jgi:hypothetical protein
LIWRKINPAKSTFAAKIAAKAQAFRRFRTAGLRSTLRFDVGKQEADTNIKEHIRAA